jgi:tryptophan-rich sensory protein
MLERGRDTLQGLLNSRDRSTAHVAIGAVLCLGVVAASAVITARTAPGRRSPRLRRAYDSLEQPRFRPPEEVSSLIWPPLFLVLGLSALRIWNARDGRDRTEALGLWGAIQALNAIWMAWGPRRRLEQLLTAIATLAATGAYVGKAGKVDRRAAALVAPYAGWVGFANLLTEELWRRNRPRGVTIH